MEFTRASQVATGVLFHSYMTTSRSWMLETLRSSTFRLRMPHRCSIGFRSGDMLGRSITFNLSFFSKAEVVLEVSLGSLSCCNTALWPSHWREGIMLCFSMSQYMLAFMVPSITVAPQCRQHSCSPRPWHSHHHAWLLARQTCLCTPHLVAVTHAWHHLNQISLSWSHQTTGHGSSNPCP